MPKKPFLIAEVAQAHHGKMEKALEYIERIATTGVDAIKFQTHIADAESSIQEPFRVNLHTDDKTRFDYWKRMEFTLDQWKELKKNCDRVGLEFLSSPFSNAAVDLLEEVGVKRYKVGSGEVTNWLLLQRIADTGKPIILSSGMSSYAELDRAVTFLKDRKVDLSILQCTTSYPTSPENYGLNVIGEIKERYGVPVGYSDHSAKIETGIAAVVMGAEILEFHVVLDRNEQGPDETSSLTIEETKQLTAAVKNISAAIENPVDKRDNSQYKDLKNMFEKTLAVNKDLKRGHILAFEDLEAKKPKGYGMEASQFEQVLGKRLVADKKQWDFLQVADIEILK